MPTLRGAECRRGEVSIGNTPMPVSLGKREAIPAPISRSRQVHSFDEIDRLRVRYVDGKIDRKGSDEFALSGIDMCELVDALADPAHWCSKIFGELEGRGQNPVARPFAAVNTIGTCTGLAVRASGPAQKPLAIEYGRESVDADLGIRHCFQIEKGASLTVLETGIGGGAAEQGH